MSLGPKQIRELLEEYLVIFYSKVSDIQITFLVADKEQGIWKANIKFKRDPSDLFYNIAMFSIDATSGDITQFKEGWTWRY
ncbi:unnamed protein product [marine sediment metagenome]|uniref:SnoaL-like domain-containing protein n=1 Tax=marine sediment metagenome TaxID=412755 RepID=X1AMK0_9ZZZZ